MQKIKSFLLCFLVGIFLAIGFASMSNATVTPVSVETCQQAWFEKQSLTSNCFKAVAVDGVVIITYHLKNGKSYDPHAQTVEFYSRNKDEVKLAHSSRLTTSRYGKFEEVAGVMLPYTADQRGNKAFPLFAVDQKGGYASLHGPIGDGNDSGGVGSHDCFRVIQNWPRLRNLLLEIQKKGGHIWYVLRYSLEK